MSLTDPTNGSGYSTEAEITQGDLTTLFRNVQLMADNRVGADITDDVDANISVTSASTFRVTAAPTSLRTLTLPDLNLSGTAYGIVWLNFDCDTSINRWQVKNVAGTTLMQTGSSATLKGGAAFVWTGSDWVVLAHTENIAV